MFYAHDNTSYVDPISQRERREELLNKIADLEHEKLQAEKDKVMRQRRNSLSLSRTQSVPSSSSASLSLPPRSRTLSSTSHTPFSLRKSTSTRRASVGSQPTSYVDLDLDNENASSSSLLSSEPRVNERLIGMRGNAGLIFETRSFHGPSLDMSYLYPHLRAEWEEKKAAKEKQEAAAAAPAAAAAGAGAGADGGRVEEAMAEKEKDKEKEIEQMQREDGERMIEKKAVED